MSNGQTPTTGSAAANENPAEQLAKAKMIPLDGNNPQMNDAITVQFNPATLRISLSNTLKANNRGGSTSNATQYVDKSSSSLDLELIFDTTMEQTDVRLKTKEVAEKFMKPIPAGGNNRPRAPKKCRFQWGAFSFDGMVATYNEAVDYFSPEGIPLRSTLTLKLSEERYQFETNAVTAAKRNTPSFSSGSGAINKVDPNLNQSDNNWRDTALYNGIESPRFSGTPGISRPNTSMPTGDNGFRFGDSSRLGTHIPGAFSTRNS